MADDMAQLGFDVDSRPVRRGTQDVRAFGEQGRISAAATDKAAKGISKSFAVVTASVTTALAAVAGFGTSMRGALEFDSSLLEVSTLIEGTVQQTDYLEKATQRLAATYGGSATSQAQAFYQAISAGAKTVEDANTTLAASNRLAIGGATDVTTAVGVLSTAMNVYAASNLTAAEASDAIFVAVRAGVTTVEELSASIGKVLPLAEKLGLSFDDTAAATAALTKGGLSTAEAVTGLRASLAAVLGPTTQAQELSKQLGLEFNAAGLEAMGFAGFMAEVVDKTGGSAESMQTLFGSVEAVGAALAFSGSAGQSMSEILVDMENKTGATTAAFDKMSESMQQRLNVVLGELGNHANDFGATLLTVAIPAMEAFSSLITLVSENTDILLLVIGSLAYTQLPFLASMIFKAGFALTSYASLTTAATVATGALGVAMNLLPFVAVASLSLLLFRGFSDSAAAAARFKTEMEGLVNIQVKLNTATANFYDNVTRNNLDAMLAQAEAVRDQVSSALEAATLELEAAKFVNTMSFGIASNDRMDLASVAIRQLAGDLMEAEARLSAAENAAHNFNSTVGDPSTADAYSEVVTEAEKLLTTMNSQNVLQSAINDLGEYSADVIALRKEQELQAFEAMLKTLDATEELKTQLIGAFLTSQDLERGASGVATQLSVAAQFALNLANNLAAAPAGLEGFRQQALQLTAQISALDAGLGQVAASSAGYRVELEARYGLATAANNAEITAISGIINREVRAYEEVQNLNNAYSDRVTALNEVGTAGGGAASETDKTTDAIEKQISALEDAADPMRAYNRGMDELNKLMSTGNLSDGAYALAVEELADKLRDAKGAADGFADTLRDGMEDALDYMLNGMKSGMDGLMDIFKNTLIAMIKYAIMNPVNVQGNMNMAGGSGGGMASSIMGGLGAGFGGGGVGALTGLGALGGGFGAAGSALLSGGPSMMMASISGQVAAAGAATAGAGAAMAAIGAVALPLLAVAAVFSLFKSKTTELDAGLRITADATETLVDEFSKLEKKNIFSKSVSEIFKPLENDGPIKDAIDAIKKQTTGLGSVLGLTADNFASFSAQIKVSLKGLSEQEANAAIVGAFDNIAEQLSYAALGHFQEVYGGIIREGETAADTLINMVSALNLVNPTFKLLGFNLFDASVQGAALARDMADLVGGFEQFAQSTSIYYDKFFSDAEKAANATREITEAFAEIGFQLPRTRDQFRQLVEAQDLTTDSGRRTTAALLQLSGAFDQVATQLDDGEANLLNALGVFAMGISEQKSVIGKAVDALVQPLEDAINRTRVDAENSYQIFKVAADKAANSAQNIVDIIGSALDSRTIISEAAELQRYRQAQQQLSRFAGGAEFNETSLSRATEGVSIDSQKFFGSFEDYARDFYKTQISLTNLAEKAQGELSDVETQIAIAEKAYQIAQGTYQEAKDFNVALDALLFDLASFTETSARNQPFIDQIKGEGERQITLLDAILVETTKQVKGMLGIETSISDLAGDNVSVADAMEILGIEEGKMAGAVLALDAPVAAIGAHISTFDTSLAGAYERLGISIGDLVNLDLAVGLEELDFFAPIADLNLAEAFEGIDLSAGFTDINLADDFSQVDLSAPFKKLDLTGALETKVNSLGDKVGLFSGALTEATSGLGINVTNLGTTIGASMTNLGTFLTSLANAVDGLASAKAAVPTPVINLYTDVLDRLPDQAGLEFWRGTGLTGQALEDAFRQGGINNGEIVPAFADGGAHSGGMRLVGEDGPELEVTGPSRIYSNANTMGMLSGNSQELVQEIRSLRQEVKGLRDEQFRASTQVAKYTKKTYDLERQWDVAGLPATRTS